MSNEQELYILAKNIANNVRGRQIVLWGDSPELRNILKKEFNLEVSFVVTILDNIVNGKSVRHLRSIEGKKEQFYLVAFGRVYEDYYDKLIHQYGGCKRFYIQKNKADCVGKF